MLLVGMYIVAVTMENSMVAPQKIKNRITIWSSNSTSVHISKRIESRVSKRYLYIHVYSSVIRNSEKAETTQVFISGWTGKQNVAHPHTGVLTSLKNEEILTPAITWVNLANTVLSRRRLTRRAEALSQVEEEEPNPDRQQGAQSLWVQGIMSHCVEGKNCQFGKMKKFWRRTVVVVVQQCECA